MDPLEQEAIELWKTAPMIARLYVKGFLRKLAARLGWQNLAREVGP